MKIPRAKPAAASLRSQTAKLRSPLALARRGAGDTAHAFDRGRRPVGFLGFLNSVCCCLPALRGSRDPRPEYPISIPVTFAPTLQPAVARQGTLALPLRLEVAEPVVAVTLLILVQSPASE